MCDLTGCDLQIAVFLFLLLFWCTKQQRTSLQTTSPRSLHLLHDANNHSRHATTPPSTPALPPSSPLAIQRAPCGHDLRGTDGGAAWQRQQPPAKISRPKRPCKDLPPKTPAQTFSPETHPPLHRSEERKGEGWRVISRLAGARCEAA